jgi:hypothetical protein
MKGAPRVIWFDTIGQVPIRIGIPEDLKASEAKAELEGFMNFLGELCGMPYADKVSIGEVYGTLMKSD